MCSPTHKKIPQPHTPPQGRPHSPERAYQDSTGLQIRLGVSCKLCSFCPSPVGPPLAPHQLAGGAEQFDRCRRGFVYIQQTALYSQSHGRRIPPLLTLWCQRGKRVSSKVGISARVGSQAAQPPDIPSLRHSPLCHWRERQ